MYYYIYLQNQSIGPLSAQQIFSTYRVDYNTPVSTDGVNWGPLHQFPELVQYLNSGYHRQPGNTPTNSRYDKTTCGLFALLLGSLGVQYFYLGKTTAGLLTILLMCVTCSAWSIIVFIQGIVMLTMSQEEFDRKYVYTNKTFPLF